MTEATVPAAPVGKVRVWDLPTRISHWLLVALIPTSWWAAEVAHRLDWHRWSGYAILGVVVFRLYWGVAGAETSRFAQFVRGPGAILAYLRGQAAPRLGHNPLGALSVLALLGLLAAQIVFGLYAVDIDGLESGPLSDRVSFDVGRQFAEWHHLAFNLLLGLIALHLAAILAYAVRRKNLIRPMITGLTEAAGDDVRPAPLWRLILGLVLAGAVTWLVMKGLRL